MEQKYVYYMLIGFVIIALAMALFLLWEELPFAISGAVLASGLIFQYYGLYNLTKQKIKDKDSYILDERVKKLGYYALNLAWEITMLFMVFLLFADLLNIIKMTAWQAIGLTFIFWCIIAVILQLSFYRIGDVD
ncbi:MAG: hypothetical protein KAW45_03165 [Thermoplasmatales archaeon]|nr:hypothetical protein [Thermoplasmatales archaeon]